MNVAVLEPEARTDGPAIEGLVGEAIRHASEWVDPEGDDWFAQIYRELATDLEPASARRPPADLVHWFG